MSRPTLKSRLQAGEQVVGVLTRMPSEELVEMAAVAGMDYILIDCEHGPADQVQLRAHITAAQVHGVDVLVRVGQHETALIQRVLDLGASGVVVPHVDTAEHARAVVTATRYPPVGDRGFATYGRAGRFGTVSAGEHLHADADTTLTIVMIESRAGCASAPEILAVAGIDGVLCGPADLAIPMGLESSADPALAAELDRIHRSVADAGRLRMDIVGGAEQVRMSLEAGASMVVVNLTHALMALLGDLVAPRDR